MDDEQAPTPWWYRLACVLLPASVLGIYASLRLVDRADAVTDESRTVLLELGRILNEVTTGVLGIALLLFMVAGAQLGWGKGPQAEGEPIRLSSPVLGMLGALALLIWSVAAHP